MSTERLLDVSEPVRVYEVGIPAGNPIHERALGDLARSFGWTIEGKDGNEGFDPSPARTLDDEVGVEEFGQISRELFGTNDYGEFALAIIECTIEQVEDCRVVLDDNHDILLRGTDQTRKIGDDTLSLGSMKDRVRFEIDHMYHPPCRVEVVNAIDYDPPPDDNGADETTLFRLLTGSITRDELGRYARSRNYPDHTLHGKIGKSIDVVNTVSSTEPLPPYVYARERFKPADFVPMDTLSDRLKTVSNLSAYQRRSVQRTIDEKIRQQIMTGRPAKFGEVVIEGDYDFELSSKRGPKSLPYLVARESLLSLAVYYQEERPLLADVVRDLAHER